MKIKKTHFYPPTNLTIKKWYPDCCPKENRGIGFLSPFFSSTELVITSIILPHNPVEKSKAVSTRSQYNPYNHQGW